MILDASRDVLAYDESGSGPALVLLHGYPHDRSLWTAQRIALAGRARVVTPDLRGFGESPAPTSGDVCTVDRYADDVATLIERLELAPAVVGGLSMGGYVTLAFWRRHPELVRALVLADTRAGADSAEGRVKRRAQQELARSAGAAAVAEQMMTGMVGRTTRESRPEVVDSLRRMLSAAPVSGIVCALEAMMSRPDSTDTLATITVPTLIIAGEEDTLTPVSESRAMHAAIPGSRLELIGGAGHASNVERPAAFTRVLCDFLDSLPAERATD